MQHDNVNTMKQYNLSCRHVGQVSFVCIAELTASCDRKQLQI